MITVNSYAIESDFTFKCSVGSLPAEKTVHLVIVYVRVLSFKDKDIYFTLPASADTRSENDPSVSLPFPAQITDSL